MNGWTLVVNLVFEVMDEAAAHKREMLMRSRYSSKRIKEIKREGKILTVCLETPTKDWQSSAKQLGMLIRTYGPRAIRRVPFQGIPDKAEPYTLTPRRVRSVIRVDEAFLKQYVPPRSYSKSK